MNPKYDRATKIHIAQTSFTIIKDPTTNEDKYIQTTPHKVYFDQHNHRYQCGCGFKGAELNFTIVTTPIPKARAIRELKYNEQKRPNTGVIQRSSF